MFSSVRFQRILLGPAQPWTFYQIENWKRISPELTLFKWRYRCLGHNKIIIEVLYKTTPHPKHYLLAGYSLVDLYVTLHFFRPQVFWWHRVHDWPPTKSLLENLLDVHHSSCYVGNPDRQYHPHVTGESFLLCLERGQGMKTKEFDWLFWRFQSPFIVWLRSISIQGVTLS